MGAGRGTDTPGGRLDVVLDLRRLDPDRSPGPFAYSTALAEALPAALAGSLPGARCTILAPGAGEAAPRADVAVSLDGGRPRPGTRSLVALHDVGHLFEKRGFGLSGWLRRNWEASWSTRQASMVIAPSEFVARAATRYLRVARDRVAIVPPGLPPWFQRAPRRASNELSARLGLPPRYFLVAGSPSPRRDLGMLVSAWSRAQQAAYPTGLVIAGAPVPAGTPAGVVELGRLPRSSMPALLSGALAMLHPGHHEGSGLAVMEAMACGTPPVVAASGALPEPVGQAGIVIAPADPDAWTATMVLFAERPSLRADLGSRAAAAAAGFTAAASAQALIPHLAPILHPPGRPRPGSGR